MQKVIYGIYLLLWVITLTLLYSREPFYLVSMPVAALITLLVIAGTSKSDLWLCQYFDIGMIISVTILPRVFWISNNVSPLQSDFFTYHTLAAALSRGEVIYERLIALFPHLLGYPSFLSIFYRVFGSDVLVAILLNLSIGVASVLLVYYLVTELSDRRFGMISAVILALWPSLIFYSTVIATEALFTLLFLVVIIYFYRVRDCKAGIKAYLLYFLLGILIGILNAVRPMGILLLISIGAYLMITHSRGTEYRRYLWKILLILIPLCMGYLISITMIKQSIQTITNRKVGTSSIGYSILVGSNYEHSGTWNTEDASLLDEVYQEGFVHPDEVNSELLSTAIDRILADPIQYLKLQFRKNQKIWQSDQFPIDFYHWYVDKDSLGWLESTTTSLLLTRLSTLYYTVIILLSTLAAISGIYRKNRDFMLFFVVLFIINWGIYIFVEVQGRYHYHLLPVLAILAGYSLFRGYELYRHRT